MEDLDHHMFTACFLLRYPECVYLWVNWPGSNVVILMAPSWVSYLCKSNPDRSHSKSIPDLSRSSLSLTKWWDLRSLKPSALSLNLITVPLFIPHTKSWHGYMSSCREEILEASNPCLFFFQPALASCLTSPLSFNRYFFHGCSTNSKKTVTAARISSYI